MCSIPQPSQLTAHTGAGNAKNIITISPISCSNWRKCYFAVAAAAAASAPSSTLFCYHYLSFHFFFLVLCFCSARIHYTFGSQSLRNHIICLFACVAMFILHDAPWWCRRWFIVLAALWFFIMFRSYLRVSNKKKLQQRDEAESIRSHRMSELRAYLPGFSCAQYIYAWSFIWLIRAMRWFIEVDINSMANDGFFFAFWLCSCVGHLVQFFLPFVSHPRVWFFFFCIFFCMNTYL